LATTGTLQVYDPDPSPGSWTTLTSMPTDRFELAAGVINGRLYAVGGNNRPANVFLNDLEEYDPAFDSWVTKASMPTPRWSLGAGVIDGKLYVIGGGNPSAVATLEVYTPGPIKASIDDLQDIVDIDPDTPLAAKAGDAQAKLQTALDELNKTPPDNQAAVGNIEGAVGDLEAAANAELLDPLLGEQLMQLMDQLAGVARQLASDAINEASSQMGESTVIDDAQQSRAEGDTLRGFGLFKDAVNKYRDALAKAESA